MSCTVYIYMENEQTIKNRNKIIMYTVYVYFIIINMNRYFKCSFTSDENIKILLWLSCSND